MNAQLQQYLPILAIAGVCIYLFFPGLFHAMDKGRKAVNAGRALIEQAEEIGRDAAGCKIQETLGRYQADKFFGGLQAAIGTGTTPAPPPIPTPAAPAAPVQV